MLRHTCQSFTGATQRCMPVSDRCVTEWRSSAVQRQPMRLLLRTTHFSVSRQHASPPMSTVASIAACVRHCPLVLPVPCVSPSSVGPTDAVRPTPRGPPGRDGLVGTAVGATLTTVRTRTCSDQRDGAKGTNDGTREEREGRKKQKREWFANVLNIFPCVFGGVSANFARKAAFTTFLSARIARR